MKNLGAILVFFLIPIQTITNYHQIFLVYHYSSSLLLLLGNLSHYNILSGILK